MAEPSPEHIEEEVAEWIEANWDPDMTVAQWWSTLTNAGLSHPMLGEHAFGRGYSRPAAQAVSRALRDGGVLGPPTGIGTMLAAPTIAEHGTQPQIDHYVRRVLDGTDSWCQLFSEPGAGSDLAGLSTKAELDGDEWVVNGQKVWTSGGQYADVGMLIARTDPDAPKHRGISYLTISMHQDGVDVRPLKEMTGRAMFNEVFLSDAKTAKDHIIGDLNDGWRVANTTLMWERSSLGAANVTVATCMPGSIAGNLDKRAGDMVAAAGGPRGTSGMGLGKGLLDHLISTAKANGSWDSGAMRQDLMKLYSLVEINRLNGQRAKDPNQRSGAEGNISKLMMSEQFRRFRDVGSAVIGADAMLMGASSSTGGIIQGVTLFSPAPAIYGGTDQVQRNIIGERALGLPKEPGPASTTPFRDLPKNG
jgi:alkylation response protein AidB-like acyl-CoA dehydrogenase